MLIIGLNNGTVQCYEFSTGAFSQLQDMGWVYAVNQMLIADNGSDNVLIVGLGGSGAVETLKFISYSL